VEYKQAFGRTVRNLLHYSDSVKNGWESPDVANDSLVYHSEIMFGKQEVRMSDLRNRFQIRTYCKYDK
jgi:PhnB protein